MIDLNNDGLLDILVAQSCQSNHVNTGKLLWLEQPSDNPNKAESWTIHEICDGPDILITIENITDKSDRSDNSQSIIVYSSQFWNEKLVYYYLNTTSNGPVISKEYLIDDTIGPVYDVQIVDIDKNGKNELLVNNHVAYANESGIWLYEFPNGWPNSNERINETFNKVLIATGFNTTEKTGVGAPGFIYPFHLEPEKEKDDAYRIGIAGDGNYFAWELIPTSSSSQKDGYSSYDYNKVEIQGVGGTVGTLGIGDVNNDGYVEVFVPWYEESKIYVYTANPNMQCKKNCKL